MKGVVLAGGRGTRLRPMTNVINKHLLPVYDEPMIYHPVRTLSKAGIDEILLISNPDNIGRYIQLLEEEGEFDTNFRYKVQKEPKGIAHGVALAEDFVDEKVAVILGDNILVGDISAEIQSFERQDDGAKVFLKSVDEPAAYGVATVEDGEVETIEEKPESPQSDYAVIGLYLYNSDVFDKIEGIGPSDRGEYEITNVNKQYISEDSLLYEEFEGKWFDAGTPEGLFQASKSARPASFDH